MLLIILQIKTTDCLLNKQWNITSLRQPTLKQDSFFGHRRIAKITKLAIQ